MSYSWGLSMPIPRFEAKYDQLLPDGTIGLSAPWQAGLSNGVNVGEILGLFVNGIVSECYGYRRTMIVSLIATIAFIFINLFAQNVQTLLVGEILIGIPLGVFQTLTVTYASEVCLVVLRAYLTTYVNLCWVIGQFIAFGKILGALSTSPLNRPGVLRALVQRNDEWAYRIAFAIQWIWPIPIIIGVFIVPKSPWWLVRKGRSEEAALSFKPTFSPQSRSCSPQHSAPSFLALLVPQYSSQFSCTPM
jgi:SP family general alpha glucoside:H+ symporter-like MFS transporter